MLLNTSTALLRMALSAVCNRTLTRSNGWPTKTEQIPPTAPAASERVPGNEGASELCSSPCDPSRLEEDTCILKIQDVELRAEMRSQKRPSTGRWEQNVAAHGAGSHQVKCLRTSQLAVHPSSRIRTSVSTVDGKTRPMAHACEWVSRPPLLRLSISSGCGLSLMWKRNREKFYAR